MKIGIIGSGNVGGTLGRRWAQIGHDVCFGVRNLDDPQLRSLLADSAPKARAATIRDAAKSADVVVLATPWDAAREAIEAAGDLTGKVLIDATNPILPALAGLSVGTNTSAGEIIQSWAKGARVVKAFNTVGANIMANTAFNAPVALFYCGDDAAAKTVTAGLAEELGFEPHDAGPLTQARLLEPFAMLWISLAMKYGYGREIAFQFMRRGA